MHMLHTYTCICTHMLHTYIHAHIACTFMHTYMRKYTYTYMNTNKHTYTYIHTYVYIHTWHIQFSPKKHSTKPAPTPVALPLPKP